MIRFEAGRPSPTSCDTIYGWLLGELDTLWIGFRTISEQYMNTEGILIKIHIMFDYTFNKYSEHKATLFIRVYCYEKLSTTSNFLFELSNTGISDALENRSCLSYHR